MKRSGPIKVGLFVFLGIILAGIAVFLIGDNRRVWDRKVVYHAKFLDVAGLKSGSPVRLGGVDVGSVTAVHHAESPKDRYIYVTLAVSRSESKFVKPDTEAQIVGKGLLGDKMVVLVGGSDNLPPAQDGTFIGSQLEPKDLGKTMDRLDDIAKKADLTMDAVQRTSEQLADPRVAEDLRLSMQALRVILEGIAQKEGTAHRLIFDEEEAKKVDRILSNLEATSANLQQVTADAKEITNRAKTGPGLVHTVVYDEALAEGTTGTMVELHNNLKAVRTGNGFAHALIYGDNDQQHVMANLNAMSDDMREIVANVKAGKGTIGGLLVDPTVYEDIKALVGNVERNQVLRALVRYSIKQSEEKPHAAVKDLPQPVVEPPKK